MCKKRRPSRITPDVDCGNNGMQPQIFPYISTISGDMSSTQNCDNISLPPDDQMDLSCPICFEIPLPPKRIYQCSQGHTICDICLNKLQGIDLTFVPIS